MQRKKYYLNLELVGVNNIVVTPIPDEKDDNSSEEEEDGGATESKKFSKGLDLIRCTKCYK